MPLPPYGEQRRTILGHFLSMDPTPMLVFELTLALVTGVVWWSVRASEAKRSRSIEYRSPAK
ncbi:hypothetical protein [Halalkalicoccus jeotgali]|nr:hypothetical protein [Halalkalicoccus jeotgali]